MTVVHPIARAWISTGGTGARNYDEFADDAEITEIVTANPESALAIEMPHRAPDSLGKSFAAALPDAVTRLARQKADGSYVAADDVVVLYRIQSSDVAGRGIVESSDVAGRGIVESSDVAGRGIVESSDVAGRGIVESSDVAGRGIVQAGEA